jgi:hypothetical protein
MSGLAHAQRQDPAHLGERARAGQVAVLVVDPLEAVEVQEDHRKRDAVALAALDLAPQVQVQVARVEQTREIVRDRELLGALEQDRVLDRDRARLDERQHLLEVRLGEAAAALVQDLEHADRAPARDERGAQDRARLERGLGVDVRREARVALDVVHDRRLAALGHPAGDALADLGPDRRGLLALGAERGLEHQLLLLLVHHQQRPGLGRDQLADLLDHELDHLARLEDRVRGLHDVGQDREPARGGGRRRLLPVRARGAGRAPRALHVRQHRFGRRVAAAPGLRPRSRARAPRSCAACARRGAPRALRAAGPAAPGARRPPASASSSPRAGSAPRRSARPAAPRPGCPARRTRTRARGRA